MYTDIKSFEDACVATKNDPKVLPDVSMISEGLAKYILAAYKLAIIAQAINEGWQPNWNKWDERKYTPYFEVSASEEKPRGFGFSYTYYDIWHSNTGASSRLCFSSSEKALYAGKQFENLFIDLHLIQE